MYGQLISIGRHNWRRALAVQVADAQLLAYEASNGEIVAVLALAHEETSWQLFNLAVDHRHQKSGVGTALMEDVIEHARKRSCSILSLTVLPDNDAAAALYSKVGFCPYRRDSRR